MRQFSLNTDKLISWIMPSQLSGTVLRAFVKVLMNQVKKSFELTYGKVSEGATSEWYFYVQPPDVHLVTAWQTIERTWRVNSSVLIYRVACTSLVGSAYTQPLNARFIINHDIVPGYTPNYYDDWIAWWDNSEGYLRLQENQGYGDGWQDSKVVFRDGVVLSLPRSLKIEEAAPSSQLLQLSKISEGSELPKCLLLSEREPEADVTFRFNKAIWVIPVPTGPSSFDFVYVGDEKIKEVYNTILAGMKPFQQLGRTFNYEIV